MEGPTSSAGSTALIRTIEFAAAVQIAIVLEQRRHIGSTDIGAGDLAVDRARILARELDLDLVLDRVLVGDLDLDLVLDLVLDLDLDLDLDRGVRVRVRDLDLDLA